MHLWQKDKSKDQTLDANNPIVTRGKLPKTVTFTRSYASWSRFNNKLKITLRHSVLSGTTV